MRSISVLPWTMAPEAASAITIPVGMVSISACICVALMLKCRAMKWASPWPNDTESVDDCLMRPTLDEVRSGANPMAAFTKIDPCDFRRV